MRLSKEEYKLVKEYYREGYQAYNGESFGQGFDAGFEYALDAFGIWKEGIQTIGCLDTPIKEIIKEVRGLNAARDD
jgi:hypothetical protein